MKLKVANIPQLSCAPYRALDGLPFLEYEENQLNTNLIKLKSGLLDAAIVPAVDVLADPNLMQMEFGMASRSRSDSMIIYSNNPLESLLAIHVYGLSKSSSTLVQLLYRTTFNRDIEIIRHESLSPLDCVSSREGALCLHQLPDMLLCNYKYRKDVASWWFEITNKPFVFLLWAIRSESAHNPNLPKFYNWLARVSNIADHLAEDFAQEYGTTPQESKIFVGDNRRYHLDHYLLDGLIEFLMRACKQQLLPFPRIRPVTHTPLFHELKKVVGQ